MLKEFFEYCCDWQYYSIAAENLSEIEASTVKLIERFDQDEAIVKLNNRSDRFGGGEAVG